MSQEEIAKLEAGVRGSYPRVPLEIREDIRAVALAIRMGEVPDQEILDRLGPEALSAKYLSRTGQRFFLLNDTMTAVRPPNPAAAAALVAAGADVNYNDHWMVFNALRLRATSPIMPFYDYGWGTPFVRLYLENGGDPNAQNRRGNVGMVALSHAHTNLEGVLLLLEHGADPWYEAPSLVTDRKMRSFFDSLAISTGNGISAEIMFRIAHAGHFKDATPEQLQVVFDTYQKFLGDIVGATSPHEKRQYVHFQAILDAILATNKHDITLSPKLAQLMADRVPDHYGGWWLRPDQVHSGDEFPGPPITNGTLIWTHADPTPRPRPEE